VHTVNRNDILKVGSFFVTTLDIVEFPWRSRTMMQNNIQIPPHDDLRYPEMWRVSRQIAKKLPTPSFKTVCRVVSLKINNKGSSSHHQRNRLPLAPGDLEIEAYIFVRPTDINVLRQCAFEVIETNQGNYREVFIY
jgi:hypothetical protein